MARTTKQTKTPATPGFAIEIKDDTELGLAILVAEFGDGDGTGGYQPIGVVVSINEAREIADSDMCGRMRDIECGKTPACSERYQEPEGTQQGHQKKPILRDRSGTTMSRSAASSHSLAQRSPTAKCAISATSAW